MEKKKPDWLKITIIILFIIYISLYVLNITGYYDGSIRRKVAFTAEQIAEFEHDVDEGIEIDMKNYLKNQNKNYANKTSNFGYEVSKGIENFLNKGLKGLGKILEKLFA